MLHEPMIYMTPHALESANQYSPREPQPRSEAGTVFQAHKIQRPRLWEQSMTGRPSRYTKELTHAAMRARILDSAT